MIELRRTVALWAGSSARGLCALGCLLTLIIVLSLGAAACAKKAPPAAAPPPPPPPAAPAAPPPPPPPAPAPAPAPSAPRTPTEDEIFASKTLSQLNAERPLGDVFFDLDESTIRDDAKGPLQKNADWMKRWTAFRSKATPTNAGRENTTSRSAIGARTRSRITW
jgi:hypothetical protein